ncbi:MAG: tripartite tricarboxylate transporter TctB family protein [Pseudomonadota bacterium]
MSEPKPNAPGLERWLVPLGIIAFCALAVWITTGFERMPPILKRGIQPSDFPQLIAGLIIFLTALMVWRDPIDITGTLGSATWGSLALIGVFVALTPIDFMLALGIFAIGLSALWGERRLASLLLVGFVVPAAVFFFFDQIFEIRFPRGLLTNIWYG